MFQIEEANADIALAMARLDDEEKEHFSLQKSVIIKRTGYICRNPILDDKIENLI